MPFTITNRTSTALVLWAIQTALPAGQSIPVDEDTARIYSTNRDVIVTGLDEPQHAEEPQQPEEHHPTPEEISNAEAVLAEAETPQEQT